MTIAVTILRTERSKVRAYQAASESAIHFVDYADGLKVFKFADGSRLEFLLRQARPHDAVSIESFQAFDAEGQYAGQAYA